MGQRPGLEPEEGRRRGGELNPFEDQPRPDPGAEIRTVRNSFFGVGLLACSLFLIFATWPLYGANGAVPQFVIWSVLMVVSARSFVRRPNLVLGLGVASLVVYAGFVLAWK